ncbi:MAG: hypothetical protein WDZ52_04565 [Pseudohongiellaceae bacterium]
MNTRQLAQGVGRNHKNVVADVNALADLGLLDKSDAGGFTAAFDEIVIHASLWASVNLCLPALLEVLSRMV